MHWKKKCHSLQNVELKERKKDTYMKSVHIWIISSFKNRISALVKVNLEMVPLTLYTLLASEILYERGDDLCVCVCVCVYAVGS